jgi:hypothetical protein
MDTAVKQEAPGYGEEPEIAYDPTAFEDDHITRDEPMNGGQNFRYEQETPERPTHVQSSGITMKEDG